VHPRQGKKWRLDAHLARFRTKFKMVALTIAETRDETQENQKCFAKKRFLGVLNTPSREKG